MNSGHAPRPVVGRLAPSPTGGLHIGHARTFLLAWLAARQEGGRLILRIEDIDSTRTRPESIQGILDDLRWLGLDWDEGPDLGGPSEPYLQSLRSTRFQSALEELKAADLIYPCACTRADIARAASAPHASEEGTVYPGTCSGRLARDSAALPPDLPFAWRFRTSCGPMTWSDLVLGRQAIDPSRHGGDFVVARNAGPPSYQLAVVVDDAAMGVTQVVRGEDLVPSTPRQLLLYRALGLEPPDFAHVPLVVDHEHRRLSKRDGAIKLSALRTQGVDPERLTSLLARSCGMVGKSAHSPLGGWIGLLDWARLPREAWMLHPRELEI